jgi:3'-5' exoribonuclease
MADFPAELATRLQHLILSHHGRHEFGSPCLPMTMEAFVLSFIDDLDAKINYLAGMSSQLSAPGYQWTDYQKTLERFLYLKGEPLPETDQDPTSTTDNMSTPEPDRQQNLF